MTHFIIGLLAGFTLGIVLMGIVVGGTRLDMPEIDISEPHKR